MTLPVDTLMHARLDQVRAIIGQTDGDGELRLRSDGTVATRGLFDKALQLFTPETENHAQQAPLEHCILRELILKHLERECHISSENACVAFRTVGLETAEKFTLKQVRLAAQYATQMQSRLLECVLEQRETRGAGAIPDEEFRRVSEGHRIVRHLVGAIKYANGTYAWGLDKLPLKLGSFAGMWDLSELVVPDWIRNKIGRADWLKHKISCPADAPFDSPLVSQRVAHVMAELDPADAAWLFQEATAKGGRGVALLAALKANCEAFRELQSIRYLEFFKLPFMRERRINLFGPYEADPRKHPTFQAAVDPSRKNAHGLFETARCMLLELGKRAGCSEDQIEAVLDAAVTKGAKWELDGSEDVFLHGLDLVECNHLAKLKKVFEERVCAYARSVAAKHWGHFSKLLDEPFQDGEGRAGGPAPKIKTELEDSRSQLEAAVDAKWEEVKKIAESASVDALPDRFCQLLDDINGLTEAREHLRELPFVLTALTQKISELPLSQIKILATAVADGSDVSHDILSLTEQIVRSSARAAAKVDYKRATAGAYKEFIASQYLMDNPIFLAEAGSTVKGGPGGVEPWAMTEAHRDYYASLLEPLRRPEILKGVAQRGVSPLALAVDALGEVCTYSESEVWDKLRQGRNDAAGGGGTSQSSSPPIQRVLSKPVEGRKFSLKWWKGT